MLSWSILGLKKQFTYRMNHETHISTQQTPPQENHRLPRSYENSRRAQNHQPPPQSGPQKTGCLIFSKGMRLRSRGEFQRVVKEGKRLVGKFFCVDCRPAKRLRLGISASSRYGSSPERNRFKRLVREAFRLNYDFLSSFELNVIPRQCAKKATLSEIREEMARLLK